MKVMGRKEPYEHPNVRFNGVDKELSLNSIRWVVFNSPAYSTLATPVEIDMTWGTYGIDTFVNRRKRTISLLTGAHLLAPFLSMNEAGKI
jgi:hypothetical protein